jgi:S1-C subfamily serine protease
MTSDNYTTKKNVNVQTQSTSWMMDDLKRRYSYTNPDPIEGIWEDFDIKIDASKIDYGTNNKVGIVKSDDGYDIIYLSGSNEFTNKWKESDLKGRLTKTGTDGLMKVEWFNSDMSVDNSVYIYLSDGNLLNISFKDKNSNVKMLKLFPIKNETQNPSITNTLPEIKSTGSGIFINKNGFIITNFHVIEDARSITVQYTDHGKTLEYSAKVVLSDKQNDLCILQISDESFKPFLNIKYGIKGASCDVGTSVFAMGYPMSTALGEEVKITDGLISSKTGYQGDVATYQISVPIQPGNSGGPLFDKQGNLVGITNAGVRSAENVGYAIKVSYLNNLIDVSPSKISLPSNSMISTLSFTEKIKVLTPYVVLIKVK